MEENNVLETEILEDFDSNGEKTSFLDVLALVRFICSFVAILAPISVTVIFSVDTHSMSRELGDFLGIFMIIMYAIGMLSALIACPIRLLGTPIRWITKGFEIGLFIPGIGCLIGALIGFVLGASVIFYAPAVITIHNALFR